MSNEIVYNNLDDVTLVLDECEKTKTIDCTMKQGDLNSRYIIAQLTKDSINKVIPVGAIAQVYVLKPDDTEIYDYCEVLDSTNGIIKIPLSQQALAVAGEIYFEVLLTWETGTGTKKQHKLSYPLVRTEVTDSLWDNNAIESRTEFSALIQALAKVDALEKEIIYIRNIIDNSIILETTIVN